MPAKGSERPAIRLAILAVKLAVAGVLVGWLLHAGTLDMGALRVLVERPELLAADLGVLAFAIVLGAVRWRLLLRLADVHLSIGRALQLHVTGLFFNIVIPGNIGGDIVKAVYVARDVDSDQRPGVYLVGLVDRVVGVGSLVLVAASVTLARGGAMWRVPGLRELAIAVAVLSALTIGGPLVVLAALHRRGRAARSLGRFAAAAQLVVARPRALALAVGLAVALHLSGLVMFATLGRVLGDDAGSVVDIATVYPLGMLTMMVPISYSGIGVGHVAFERLFALLGMTGGATTFNVFLIGQTAPCLLGVFPYLALRRAAPLPTAAEAEAQAVGGTPEPTPPRIGSGNARSAPP